MKIEVSVTASVFARFPDLGARFYLLDAGIHYSADESPDEVSCMITDSVRATYADAGAVLAHPVQDAYARFYQNMGLKIKDVSTPFKQAARFFNKSYQSRGRAIDYCMYAEYLTGVSFQLYDADRLPEAISYDMPLHPLEHVDLAGKSGITRIGELVLTASATKAVHCPSRGGSKDFGLTDDTKMAVIRMLRIPSMPEGPWAVAHEIVLQYLPPASFVELSLSSPSGTVIAE